jgi:hypothetical protein
MFDTFDDEAGRDAHRLIATSVICFVRSTGQPQGSTTAQVALHPDSADQKAAALDEGVGYGLTLEGISAADIARSTAANNRSFQPKTTARRGAIRVVATPQSASAFRQLAPHLLSCRRPASRLSKSRRRFGIRCPASLCSKHLLTTTVSARYCRYSFLARLVCAKRTRTVRAAVHR